MRNMVVPFSKIAFLLLLHNCAFAWGLKGHQIIADIAFQYLDDATKQSVKKYLGAMTFEQAATWMDDMRNDPAYDYMKPWHYINIEKGKVYDPHSQNNIIAELNKVIAELQHKEALTDSTIKIDIASSFI